MKKRVERPDSRGYLLPIVIALAMAVSIIFVNAIGVIANNSRTLESEYYNQLGVEAAQAGVAAATRCIEVNQIDWDQNNGKPQLAPQTDCNGATIPGKPTTVVNNDGVESTYSVKGLENPYGNFTRIILSTGTVTIKDSHGTAVKTITQTVRTFGRISPVFGNATDISTGGDTTCAVAAGGAYCWGDNSNGQLGAGHIGKQNLPVAVNTGVMFGKTVTKISVGINHTCAVASGQAYCWGNNWAGQLGDGTNTFRWNPVAVRKGPGSALFGKTVTDIEAGQDFTCALTADAQVACWGYGGEGSLGTNSYADSTIPQFIYRNGWYQQPPYDSANCEAGFYTWCFAYWPPPRSQPGQWIPPSPLNAMRVTGLGRPHGRTMCVTAVSQSDTTTQNAGFQYCWGRGISPPIQSNYGLHLDCSVYSPGWDFGGSTSSFNDGNSAEPAAMPGGIWGAQQQMADSRLNSLSGNTMFYWDSGYRNLTVSMWPDGTWYNFCLTYAWHQECFLFFCVSIPLPELHMGAWVWNSFSLVGESYHTPYGAWPMAMITGDISGGDLFCHYNASTLYCNPEGSDISQGKTGSGFYPAGTTYGWDLPVKLNGTASLGSQLPITAMDSSNDHVCVIASQKVYCWGANASGQDGDGTFKNAFQPVQVQPSLSILNSPAVTKSTFDFPVTF